MIDHGSTTCCTDGMLATTNVINTKESLSQPEPANENAMRFEQVNVSRSFSVKDV